jgi:transcriptional regulator with XRE-family HTH domain
MTVDTKLPNPVDIHVGGRVRMRRKQIGLTQEALGDVIDLTFQQIQKYERGTNRVSASKLYQIAKTLNVPITYFFDGYLGDEVVTAFNESDSEALIHNFLMSSEGIELAEAFSRIKTAKYRRKILDLVRTLAEA